ncbi:MAG: hypothetical protein HXY46_01920 [Syntrophaceae bacterium]|nr:hypothetical protein [Syntrophaceae bacterium]
MSEEMLKSYFKKIFEVGKTGDATEVSYYSALEDLLRTYGESLEKKKFHTTTLPKKTEAGNPDFRVWDGKQHIVGYIEAKPPTIDYLDQIETTDQLKRACMRCMRVRQATETWYMKPYQETKSEPLDNQIIPVKNKKIVFYFRSGSLFLFTSGGLVTVSNTFY